MSVKEILGVLSLMFTSRQAGRQPGIIFFLLSFSLVSTFGQVVVVAVVVVVVFHSMSAALLKMIISVIFSMQTIKSELERQEGHEIDFSSFFLLQHMKDLFITLLWAQGI